MKSYVNVLFCLVNSFVVRVVRAPKLDSRFCKHGGGVGLFFTLIICTVRSLLFTIIFDVVNIDFFDVQTVARLDVYKSIRTYFVT